MTYFDLDLWPRPGKNLRQHDCCRLVVDDLYQPKTVVEGRIWLIFANVDVLTLHGRQPHNVFSLANEQV